LGTVPDLPPISRNQARLTGGVLSLQAHDPTTNIDFKEIRVAELPRRSIP
jgi:hypothetical protein